MPTPATLIDCHINEIGMAIRANAEPADTAPTISMVRAIPPLPEGDEGRRSACTVDRGRGITSTPPLNHVLPLSAIFHNTVAGNIHMLTLLGRSILGGQKVSPSLSVIDSAIGTESGLPFRA